MDNKINQHLRLLLLNELDLQLNLLMHIYLNTFCYIFIIYKKKTIINKYQSYSSSRLFFLSFLLLTEIIFFSLRIPPSASLFYLFNNISSFLFSNYLNVKLLSTLAYIIASNNYAKSGINSNIND